MAKTLLIPGEENITEETPIKKEERYFLLRRLFGELSDDEEKKSQARTNLGVQALHDILDDPRYTNDVKNKVNNTLTEYLNNRDLVDKGEFEETLNRYALKNSDVTFNKVKVTDKNFNRENLITLGYVLDLLKNYLKADQKTVESWIESAANNLAKKDNVYDKESIDTLLKQALSKKQSEIDQYVMRKDGRVGFTAPVKGRYPETATHLATWGSVKDIVNEHKTDPDAHGFITKLNNTLKKYALKEQVIDKTQTYTRAQIDDRIEKLVSDTVDTFINSYLELKDPHGIMDLVRQEKYVKQDGSVPFRLPQQGEDAKDEKDLVTLRQVQAFIEELKTEIEKQGCFWKTSGPVQTTVGFLEDESEVPERMSIQEVLDTIFYGKRMTIHTPDSAPSGQKTDITVCITGDISDVDYAELFKNGEVVRKIEKVEFEETGCVTVTVEITEDSVFDFTVHYKNGTEHTESSEMKLALPVFVGLIPKWKWGSDITYGFLQKAVKYDSINNAFYDVPESITELEHYYNFDLEEPVKLAIALPKDYPDLTQIQNGVQAFNVDAFDIENFDVLLQTSFSINGKSELYKIYIYKQPLVRLDSNVTFNF